MSQSFTEKMFNRRMLTTLLLGFSSGLPLILTGSTLQAMMTDAKINLGTIGLVSLIGLPYTLKFLVAPLFDRYVPPVLNAGADRRRGWMLIFQVALIFTIAGIGMFNPADMLVAVGAIAVCTAVFSALQDIIIDAYRREIFSDEELGFATAVYVAGYRAAMLFSGAFALFLADNLPWRSVYLIMSSAMAVGILATLFAPKTPAVCGSPRTLRGAIVEPFREYFSRNNALIVLLFILLYKIGDNMATSLNTPFILSLGFSKTEFALLAKTVGMASLITGGLVGGAFMLKLGMNRSLWVFGVLQVLGILTFAGLAHIGHSHLALTAAILMENLAFGMGTTAYSAFMASITDRRFTATQYALLTSLMGVPRVVISSPTGYLAAAVGWEWFFYICALCAIPGMLLLLKFAPWGGKEANAR